MFASAVVIAVGDLMIYVSKGTCQYEHMCRACRGERITFTMDRVPGDGIVTNMHITDYNITGTVPGELCRFDRLAVSYSVIYIYFCVNHQIML